MFEPEASWIASELERTGVRHVLNVGSSTLKFRTVDQPFIHDKVVAPLESRGGRFLHIDLKAEEGVDMAGDLMDPAFRERVKAQRCDAVICSNLLEHVVAPQTVCNLLSEVVVPGGYIILTVPHRYPYHSDPIDTMFRPDVNRLSSMLPGFERVSGSVLVLAGTSFAKLLIGNPRLLVNTVVRSLMPFYKHGSWKHIVGYLPHIFKPFEVTCVTFRR